MGWCLIGAGWGQRKRPGNTRVAAWDTLGVTGTQAVQRPACEAEFEAGTLKELCTRCLLPLPCSPRPRASLEWLGSA